MIWLFDKRIYDITEKKLYYNYDEGVNMNLFAKLRFEGCRISPLRYLNYYKMSLKFFDKDDYLLGISENTKKKIVMVQRAFRIRKLVYFFSYIVSDDTVFPFFIYWMPNTGIIMFKIYLICNLSSYINKNKQ
jgi:hypothetical protein